MNPLNLLGILQNPAALQDALAQASEPLRVMAEAVRVLQLNMIELNQRTADMDRKMDMILLALDTLEETSHE